MHTQANISHLLGVSGENQLIPGERSGNRAIPYSGKFSPGKNFAKARANVLQKKFVRFNFVQPGLGEI